MCPGTRHVDCKITFLPRTAILMTVDFFGKCIHFVLLDEDALVLEGEGVGFVHVLG